MVIAKPEHRCSTSFPSGNRSGRVASMIIGLPKEIKDNEYRVGLTPAGVRALKDAGHDVRVETNAGAGSGFEDSLYERAGGTIIGSADEVWASADMIVKV